MSRENRFKSQNIKLLGANRNLSHIKQKKYIYKILKIIMI